jgi:ribosome-associated toxin RatA of RatAB toxin-antitoxin module
MEARRSVLVAHPAERMFDLIEAAEHYPAFLPWCAAATVLQRDDEIVVARLQVAYLGARFEFTTRNPKRRPEFMAIGLEQGPFQRFEGTWNLKPLSTWGCRIDFALSYDFSSSVMGSLASPVFQRIADTLVDAFIQRADRLFLDVPVPAPSPPPPLPTPPSAPSSPPPPDPAAPADETGRT